MKTRGGSINKPASLGWLILLGMQVVYWSRFFLYDEKEEFWVVYDLRKKIDELFSKRMIRRKRTGVEMGQQTKNRMKDSATNA